MWRVVSLGVRRAAAVALLLPGRAVAAAPAVLAVPRVPAAVLPLLLVRGLKYKLKTKSSVKKRFRQTGSGTFRRMNTGKSHLNESKPRKKVRKAGKWRLVTSAQEKSLYKLLPGSRNKVKARHRRARVAFGHPRTKGYRKPAFPALPPAPPKKARGYHVVSDH